MTKEEIKIQKALGTYLPMKWGELQKLWKEGQKLYEEGDKLHSKAEKLRSEGTKLRNRGWKLYRDAVKEVYGDKKVEIDWDTGEVEIL